MPDSRFVWITKVHQRSLGLCKWHEEDYARSMIMPVKKMYKSREDRLWDSQTLSI